MIDNINLDQFQQEVLSNNLDIYNRIYNEIKGANTEVLIASSWFTDEELFKLLLDKAEEVKIEVLLCDNEDNKRLDFDKLIEKGGIYTKVKNVGYGIMHEKYCVIDRKLVIHGSYNYTNNAKRNNRESVIVTNHIPTVNQLIENFYSTKEKSQAMVSPTPLKENGFQNEIPQGNMLKKPEYQVQFENLLTSYLDSEINVFDRKELRDMGFKRSESSYGDYKILANSLDTVYFKFLNDINISDDVKKELLLKISELRTSQLKSLEDEKNRLLVGWKIELETKKINYNNSIDIRKSNIQVIDKKIEGITSIDIKNEESKIENIKEIINQLKLTFVKPKIRWFDFLPLALINSILFIYLSLFYSSAAYILLFSKSDTIKAIKDGAEIPPHQVFEPKAISLALGHGGTSILFIFLFVFVPISFALADRYVASKFWKIFISYFLGIFLIDSFVAYSVSKSIHELRYLTGEVGETWQFEYAFSDVNFYLVFVMGAAALLVFKFIFTRLMTFFEARSSDLNSQKNSVVITQYNDRIADHKEVILRLRKDVEVLEVQRIEESRIKDDFQFKLDQLPLDDIIAKEKIESEHEIKRDYYDKICDIYKNRIENNGSIISIDALKDRINVFLEGWNDFLHGYFSNTIAMDKSHKATEVADNWLLNKIKENNMLKQQV